MVTAYVLAQFGDLQDPQETMSALRAIAGIKQAHAVMGPTDIITFVESADLNALGVTVLAILAVDGVARADKRLAWPI